SSGTLRSTPSVATRAWASNSAAAVSPRSAESAHPRVGRAAIVRGHRYDSSMMGGCHGGYSRQSDANFMRRLVSGNHPDREAKHIFGLIVLVAALYVAAGVGMA